MHRHRSRTPLQLNLSLWHSFLNWQTKVKTRSASISVFGCNGSTMCLDDRPHDGKAHSEAVVLGGEELLEKPITGSLGDPGAIVAHDDGYCSFAVIICGNLHCPAAGRCVMHGIKGI